MNLHKTSHNIEVDNSIVKNQYSLKNNYKWKIFLKVKHGGGSWASESLVKKKQKKQLNCVESIEGAKEWLLWLCVEKNKHAL